MSFFNVQILFYIPVYLQIQLARLSVWSAVENGVNVRENDANGTEIVSPLMIVIYIMLYDGSVMYCKPKTK